MSDARFQDRIVFVTGAGSGVGRATARLFAGEGAKVFAVDVNETGLRETLDAVRAAGGTAEGERCDVAARDAVRASIERAVARFGGLDILLNVAGIGRALRFEEITPEEWQRTLDVNLTGSFNTIQAALPHLLGRKGANVVNVASISGLRGQAYNAHYCASKAGLLNLSRSLALEFVSRGLRVNCVCPGGIATPLIRGYQPREDFEPRLLAYYSPPIDKLMAQPEEIAGAIAYLASDAARMVNGVGLVIDAGTLA